MTLIEVLVGATLFLLVTALTFGYLIPATKAAPSQEPFAADRNGCPGSDKRGLDHDLAGGLQLVDDGSARCGFQRRGEFAVEQRHFKVVAGL